jgi:hypothetical protein
MASEDSVEHMLERALPLLAVRVHRVGELDDLRQPFGGAMGAGLVEIHDHHEAREVAHARREAHVALQERNDPLSQQRTRIDRVDQHGLVPWLGRDAPALELLDGHLEQCAPASVLRDAERGLDVEAQGHRAMRLTATCTLPSPSMTPARNQRRCSLLDSLSC